MKVRVTTETTTVVQHTYEVEVADDLRAERVAERAAEVLADGYGDLIAERIVEAGAGRVIDSAAAG